MNDMKALSLGTGAGAGPDISQRFSLDTQGFSTLRKAAHDDPATAKKEVAKQVDASFMQMMLKSMRDATPSNGILDSQDGKTYQSMLDGQLAQELSSKGIGLADSLLKQMGGPKGTPHGGDMGRTGAAGGLAGADGLDRMPSAGRATQGALVEGLSGRANAAAIGQHAMAAFQGGDDSGEWIAGAAAGARAFSSQGAQYGQRGPGTLESASAFSVEESAPIRSTSKNAHVNEFIDKLSSAAQAASEETGIPAHFILSQVALESGWGKSEIRTHGGEKTHNVLGVKAGADWNGPTVMATTTEYVHGRPHRVEEKFRAYSSYTEALEDYAKVLKGNSRYEPALRASNTASGFANGLQKAGYATDPHYAKKLLAIIKQMV